MLALGSRTWERRMGERFKASVSFGPVGVLFFFRQTIAKMDWLFASLFF
jgi:hypothetical protein